MHDPGYTIQNITQIKNNVYSIPPIMYPSPNQNQILVNSFSIIVFIKRTCLRCYKTLLKIYISTLEIVIFK